MDTIGPWELLLIILVVGLLFGSSRLPSLARGFGEGLREFRSALHGDPDPAHRDDADTQDRFDWTGQPPAP